MAKIIVDTTAKLFKAIKAGQFDSDLDAIREAVNTRMDVRRESLTIDDYPIGAKVKVRLNDTAGARYTGRVAVVVGYKGTKIKKAMLKIDGDPDPRPVGCAISLLDLI